MLESSIFKFLNLEDIKILNLLKYIKTCSQVLHFRLIFINKKWGTTGFKLLYVTDFCVHHILPKGSESFGYGCNWNFFNNRVLELVVKKSKKNCFKFGSSKSFYFHDGWVLCTLESPIRAQPAMSGTQSIMMVYLLPNFPDKIPVPTAPPSWPSKNYCAN